MATCSDRTLVARFSIPPALVICLKMTQFVSVRRRCTYFNELNGSWCQNFTPLTSNKEIFCWRLLRQVSFQLIFLTSPIRFWRITSSPGALQRPSTTELVGTKMSYKLSFSFHSKEKKWRAFFCFKFDLEPITSVRYMIRHMLGVGARYWQKINFGWITIHQHFISICHAIDHLTDHFWAERWRRFLVSSQQWGSVHDCGRW